MDILHGAAQVPGAIGGGALDILIGDRTNVTPGEQAKRAIQALLLGGEHGENLLALQHLNAQQDALNYKSVGSPQFQSTFEDLRASGVPDQEAYQQAAQLYGISGFQPTTITQTNRPVTDALDAAIGQVGGAPLGRVPLSQPQEQVRLPPPSATDQVKYLKAQTQLGAAQDTDPIERVVARYKMAGLDPPPELLRLRSQRMLPEAQPGIQSRNLTYNADGSISASVNDLPLAQRFYTADPVGEAQADLDIALTNRDLMRAGSDQVVVKARGPNGIGVQSVKNPLLGPLAQGAVKEFGDTHDPRVFDLYQRYAQPNAGPPPATPGDNLDRAIAGAAPGAPAAPAGPPLLSRVERKRQDEMQKLRDKYGDPAVTAQPDGTLVRNPAFKGTAAADAAQQAALIKQRAAAENAQKQWGIVLAAKDNQQFIEGVAKTFNNAIDALPKDYPQKFERSIPGAFDSLVSKVQYPGEAWMQLEGSQPIVNLNSISNGLLTLVGRHFGEKQAFTDRDAARFGQTLPKAGDSIETMRTKTAELVSLVQEISARAQNIDAGQPFTPPQGEKLLTGEQFATQFAPASETGSTAPAPNAQATPQAGPSAAPASAGSGITRDQAIAELRRRGKL